MCYILHLSERLGYLCTGLAVILSFLAIPICVFLGTGWEDKIERAKNLRLFGFWLCFALLATTGLVFLPRESDFPKAGVCSK